VTNNIISNTITTVKPAHEKQQDSTKHEAVMSMKNLLSIHMTAIKINTTTTLAPHPTLGKELQERLLDNSEIDLSPPNPVINPSSSSITDQASFQSLLLSRTTLLDHHCRGRSSRGVVRSSYLYVLESRSLVWCPVYKAASTNWMHNLLHLAGKKEEEIEKIIKDHPGQPNDQGRVVAPIKSLSTVEKISRQENARLLIIVRHPFDRLVSAFRDKLEQCHGPENCTLNNNWYYKQYGRKIVSTYRKRAIKKFGNGFFSERNNFGAPLPVNRTWRSSAYPSWWEFVQYILDTSPSTYDEHWKPSSLYCSVCSFPYNHILHFETIQAEERLFAEEMGAGDLIHPRWENRNDEGLHKEEILGKYFSLLDDQDINALYRIYEDDFKMFGYQFQYRNLVYNT